MSSTNNGDSEPKIPPLPRPLGRDKATVINQPVKLIISEFTQYEGIRIADAWGHEIIHVRDGSWSLGCKKYEITCVHTGKILYKLRRNHRNNSYSPDLVEIETPNKERLARFDHDGGRQWGVLWKNTAWEGEDVAINEKGDRRDRFPSLVWGPSPVVLFDRCDADDYKGFRFSSRDYVALVAPGADLVWIATLITALELIHYNKFY